MKKAIGSVKWSPKIGTFLPQKLGIWPATIRLVTLSQISGLSTNAFCQFSRKSARFRGRWADSASLLRPARGTGMAGLSGLKSPVCMVVHGCAKEWLTYAYFLSLKFCTKSFREGPWSPCRAQNVHDLILGAQRAKSRILSRERWTSVGSDRGLSSVPTFLKCFFCSFCSGYLGMSENGGCLYGNFFMGTWGLQPLDTSFRQPVCWFVGYLSATNPRNRWFSFPSIPWLLVVLVPRWCRSTAGGIFARAGFRGKLQFFRGKMNENDDTVTCLNLGYSRGLFETTPYDSIWPWGMQPIWLGSLPRLTCTWGAQGGVLLRTHLAQKSRPWTYGHGPRRITLQVADFGGFVPSALVADIWRSR